MKKYGFISNSPAQFFSYYTEQFKNFFEDSYFFLNKHNSISEKIVLSSTTNATSVTGILKDLTKVLKVLKNRRNIEGYCFLSTSILNIPQMLILKFIGAKLFFVVHDPIPHPDNKSWLVEKVNHLCCLLSDVIILHNKKSLKAFKGFYNKKVYYLPLVGYDLNPREKKLNNKLLIFGRMEPYKGLENIIKYLDQGVFCNWQLTIAGKGHIPENLFNYENVQVINRFIPDIELEKLIEESSFVILPYDSATQSAIILHSFSYSTPVIAHNVGGLDEYLNNKLGLLFNHNDSEKLKSFLKNITEDTYDEYILNINSEFKKSYSSDIILKKLNNLLEKK